MANATEVLEIFQNLIAYGYYPPTKAITIERMAEAWAKVLSSADPEALGRALNDEVAATNFWPKLPAILKRMGLIDGAPSEHEGSEVLPLLLRIARSSASKRNRDSYGHGQQATDYDPIAELYPFGGPRVEALRRALMAAGGWKGLGELPANLGDDPRACADIRKAYQGALKESYDRHRRDGLPIPRISIGGMMSLEQNAADARRQLSQERRNVAIGATSRPALTDGSQGAQNANRRALAKRLAASPGEDAKAALKLLAGGEE